MLEKEDNKLTLPIPHLEISQRLFLVGCPRSGTTILQVLMANHSRIHSFPETQFFETTVRRKRRPLAWLGLATGKERQEGLRFLNAIERMDLAPWMPTQPLLYRNAVGQFIHILDRMALEMGRDIWLEKSPSHIDYIEIIQNNVADVHFIHILRDGREVVASLYDMALRYPESFPDFKNIENAIRVWNHSLQISSHYVNRPGHTVVFHEQLVEQPETVLRQICDDVGIVFEPGMLQSSQASEKLIMPHWQWMKGALEPVKAPASKFTQLFDAATQEFISRSLKLGEFEKLGARNYRAEKKP